MERHPADGPHGFVVSSPLIPETTEFATRAVTFISKYFSFADTDADGLSDGWELSRFNSLAQGANDDANADDQNNLAEWCAGTHPLDNVSAIQISAITLTPTGQVTLRFPFVPGLGHVVDFSPDLQTWQTIASPVFSEPQGAPPYFSTIAQHMTECRVSGITLCLRNPPPARPRQSSRPSTNCPAASCARG